MKFLIASRINNIQIPKKKEEKQWRTGMRKVTELTATAAAAACERRKADLSNLL